MAKKKPIKVRNPYADARARRKAGPLKDRREPRKGSRNLQRKYGEQNED